MAELRLIVKSQSDVEYVVTVLFLGFLRTVRLGSAHLLKAEQQLFWPWAWDEVARAGCGPRIIELLKRASELDDIRKLAPDTYDRVLNDLEEEAQKILLTLNPDPESQPERWIQASEPDCCGTQ